MTDGFCSRCYDHAVFTVNEDDEELSECCGAQPVPEDVPAWAVAACEAVRGG